MVIASPNIGQPIKARGESGISMPGPSATSADMGRCVEANRQSAEEERKHDQGQ
jgi:hypothetical protein